MLGRGSERPPPRTWGACHRRPLSIGPLKGTPRSAHPPPTCPTGARQTAPPGLGRTTVRRILRRGACANNLCLLCSVQSRSVLSGSLLCSVLFDVLFFVLLYVALYVLFFVLYILFYGRFDVLFNVLLMLPLVGGPSRNKCLHTALHFGTLRDDVSRPRRSDERARARARGASAAWGRLRRLCSPWPRVRRRRPRAPGPSAKPRGRESGGGGRARAPGGGDPETTTEARRGRGHVAYEALAWAPPTMGGGDRAAPTPSAAPIPMGGADPMGGDQVKCGSVWCLFG